MRPEVEKYDPMSKLEVAFGDTANATARWSVLKGTRQTVAPNSSQARIQDNPIIEYRTADGESRVDPVRIVPTTSTFFMSVQLY